MLQEGLTRSRTAPAGTGKWLVVSKVRHEAIRVRLYSHNYRGKAVRLSTGTFSGGFVLVEREAWPASFHCYPVGLGRSIGGPGTSSKRRAVFARLVGYLTIMSSVVVQLYDSSADV